MKPLFPLTLFLSSKTYISQPTFTVTVQRCVYDEYEMTAFIPGTIRRGASLLLWWLAVSVCVSSEWWPRAMQGRVSVLVRKDMDSARLICGRKPFFVVSCKIRSEVRGGIHHSTQTA
jgi:hypothetical protein